jgi:hypothetical protein
VHEIQDAESRRETRELPVAAGPRMAPGMAAPGAAASVLPVLDSEMARELALPLRAPLRAP